VDPLLRGDGVRERLELLADLGERLRLARRRGQVLRNERGALPGAGGAGREGELVHGVGEVALVGEHPLGEGGRAGDVEQRQILGRQLQIGEVELLAIDDVSGAEVLVAADVPDGDPELEELGLVPLELADRGLLGRRRVLVGEVLLQLAPGDRPIGIEQQRREIEEAFGFLHGVARCGWGGTASEEP
jgi:hypothetical protein